MADQMGVQAQTSILAYRHPLYLAQAGMQLRDGILSQGTAHRIFKSSCPCQLSIEVDTSRQSEKATIPDTQKLHAINHHNTSIALPCSNELEFTKLWLLCLIYKPRRSDVTSCPHNVIPAVYLSVLHAVFFCTVNLHGPKYTRKTRVQWPTFIHHLLLMAIAQDI